jgi:hypothetical protein
VETPVTQRERIHSMLRAAGTKGVSSKAFIANYMPRAAARIQELKDSGVEISSEREGKYVRYRVVGSGSGNRWADGVATCPRAASAASSDRPVPSMFDADDCLDWNQAA